jgi:phage terminase small subunit
LPALRNARQERFVQALVGGTPVEDAYRLAGYKADDSHGSRLMRRPAIRRRYDELLAEAARHTEVTGARVMEELAAIAFANILDFVTIGTDGILRPDFARVTRAQAKSVVEANIDEKTGKTRIKLGDKRAALVDLAKMLGLFREQIEVTPPKSREQQELDEFEAAKRIAFALNSAIDKANRLGLDTAPFELLPMPGSDPK